MTASDGAVYHGTPETSPITLTGGQTTNYTVTYTAVATQTGTANVQIGGLPTGTAGSVTITGNGVNQTVTQTGTVNLPPGTYTVTANKVSTSQADYEDPQPSRSITITNGATANVSVNYAVTAQVRTFSFSGLPNSWAPNLTITGPNGFSQTVTTNGQSLRLPLGMYSINVPDQTWFGSTYRVNPNVQTSLLVGLALGDPIVTIAYYRAVLDFLMNASTIVLLDPNGHATFINMWLNNVLDLEVLFDPPPFDPPPGVAPQTVPVTGATRVTITGPAPWVTVTGTRQATGTINLTGNSGSQTVAGFTNVAALLTGTLTDTGALQLGSYKMGSDTAPFSLPNGSITYRVTGTPTTTLSLRLPPR